MFSSVTLRSYPRFPGRVCVGRRRRRTQESHRTVSDRSRVGEGIWTRLRSPTLPPSWTSRPRTLGVQATSFLSPPTTYYSHPWDRRSYSCLPPRPVASVLNWIPTPRDRGTRTGLDHPPESPGVLVLLFPFRSPRSVDTQLLFQNTTLVTETDHLEVEEPRERTQIILSV